MVEQKVQQAVDIPVFHDDQHGTAIILTAALLNALEITGKKLEEIKVVFSGAGAAGIACARQLHAMGVPRENIWMCDIAGLVYKGRKEEMFAEKAWFANGDQPSSLADTFEGADVFIGLSTGKIVSSEMIKRMDRDPIIFAMANPEPEISFDDARAARLDAIVATGRSDYPNQINNVLGFPFIFRGALDVRAKVINQEMKNAASQALAALAHEPVPADVLRAYHAEHLEFGRDYLVPKPLDKRALVWVSHAVAEAAIKSDAARKLIDLGDYLFKLQQLADRL